MSDKVSISIKVSDNVLKTYTEYTKYLLYYVKVILNAYNVKSIIIIKKYFFLTRELSLINTCCWRADHEIMHDGASRSALIFVDLPDFCQWFLNVPL